MGAKEAQELHALGHPETAQRRAAEWEECLVKVSADSEAWELSRPFGSLRSYWHELHLQALQFSDTVVNLLKVLEGRRFLELELSVLKAQKHADGVESVTEVSALDK